MTFGRLSILASAAIAVGALAGFLATGSVGIGYLLLAAPIPAGAVYWFFPGHADWTLWEATHRGPSDLEDALDETMRPPISTPSHTDGGYFVPGVPALNASAFEFDPPLPCDSSPLVSSPPSPRAPRRST